MKFASYAKEWDANIAAVHSARGPEILECELLSFHLRRVFTGALRNLIERENYE
jgi:histidinol phosphatase-like PHP family hydrolase